MEKTIKLKILNSIGSIYDQAKDCKLDSSFFEKADVELKLLSEYFKVSPMQSFFTSMVFALNYKGITVDYNDLMQYFDCNPMRVLEFSDDFESLCSKGIFIKQKSTNRVKLSGANDQYTVNEKVSEAILRNKPMPDVENEIYKDVNELLETISNLMEQGYNQEISTNHILLQSKKIISSNLHFPIIKRVSSFGFIMPDSLLYLYLIWRSISGSESIEIEKSLTSIFQISSVRITYLTKLLSGDNNLIKNNLIEIVPARFLNDSELKLTDHSLSILTECEIKHFINRKKRDNVITPSDISPKQLIYNECERRQIDVLRDLLDETKFTETQSRLRSKGLPHGITVLLFGVAGTGKTELAKQLALSTNRKIMKVEISQSKSMWYGESEKVVKRIFTDYRTFAKECERTPILLFNEADAIISKRREIGNSNISQTENTIQNILLEELENFEGILLATTNLAKNLDTAFERRFLFKIEFKKPDMILKVQLWKLKLSTLNDTECEELAMKFDFSGGQIDNIVRKNEIHEIIQGSTASFNTILDFCKEESLEKGNRVNIGFSKSA
jgi:SpoVK/Ycf46/Vps4 family AAA+-type ATPase